MKLKPLLLQGLIVSAFGIGSASASPFTVYLTAHVTAVNDSSGVLGGQVTVGQNATGQYTYETTVPNADYPSTIVGYYAQAINQGAISLSLGSLAFKSDPASPYWNYAIQMHADIPQGYDTTYLRIDSGGNKALANGSMVHYIGIDLEDFSGYAPSSVALPTSAPDLTHFSQRNIQVFGDEGSQSSSWSVTFSIDSVTTVPPPPDGWSISPSTGSFSRAQRFDAALLLPPGSQVQNVRSLIGGMPGPFNLSLCQLLPPNSKGQPVILCPNAPQSLLNGVTHIEWQVQLTNGTVLDKTVDWEIIP